MPTYVYVDQPTGFTKEVMHPMSEMTNPSPQTLAEITHEGRVMTRGVTAPNIAVFGSLSALSKKDRLKPKRPEIQKKIIQRSRDDAKRQGIGEIKHEVNRGMREQAKEMLKR